MQEPHQMKRLHLLWSSPGCIEADSNHVVILLCYYMPPKHQHHTTINFKYTTMAPNHWGSVQKEEISSLGCNKAGSSVDIVRILLLSLLYYWNICTLHFQSARAQEKYACYSVGQGKVGGSPLPTGQKSMATSGFGCRKALVDTGIP